MLQVEIPRELTSTSVTASPRWLTATTPYVRRAVQVRIELQAAELVVDTLRTSHIYLWEILVHDRNQHQKYTFESRHCFVMASVATTALRRALLYGKSTLAIL
jgi:hypothetical protein